MGTKDPRIDTYIAKAAPFAMVKRAVELNKAAQKPCAVVVPAALLTALNKNKKARAAFEGMSPSHQREYCEWIADAKRDETRARRIEKALALLSENRSMNWKYE